ncbi:MAG: FadR family transcriptional regulator [Clostridia bacterium]|nr:FadR family transcriptional regulator [Clostridia bacterium]
MFQQVNKSSLSQQIAEILEQTIIEQKLQVGDRLPGEIELADQFGASRNVVREAIAMLRERRLVEVRNGSGAYVTQISPEALGSVVTRMTAVGCASSQEVYEIRMALEVRACGLAAQNSNGQEKITLQKIVQKMEKDYADLHQWYAIDCKFHQALSAMTHNPLFPAFLEPLIALVFAPNDAHFMQPSLNARLGGAKQHRRILGAIERSDRAAAEQAMADHLQTYLDDIINHEPPAPGATNI